MYSLLIRLMVLAALVQLGLNLTQSVECKSRECLVRLEKASREVLKIDWRSISVFPEEARRFQ